MLTPILYDVHLVTCILNVTSSGNINILSLEAERSADIKFLQEMDGNGTHVTLIRQFQPPAFVLPTYNLTIKDAKI